MNYSLIVIMILFKLLTFDFEFLLPSSLKNRKYNTYKGEKHIRESEVIPSSLSKSTF